MKHNKLGELDVSRIGLGAMPMNAFYTGRATDEAEGIRTIHPHPRSSLSGAMTIVTW
ncbi:hypothetical protein ACWGH8_04745 [Nonomuraea muscovyensis]|uniref:hypothetical protein n=1 Tax=Nonomuraea muscovyensis TaxID=1124761 RepID=UPI0033DF6B3D